MSATVGSSTLTSRSLVGKVSVITGAGSGIGRATAQRLSTDGAAVVVADLRAEAVERVAAEIVEKGGRAIACPTDVRDENQVGRLMALALSSFGRIDILVNSAAIMRREGIDVTSVEAWNEVLHTNLTGTFLCIRSAVPAMKRQRFGRIVNTTSTSAFRSMGIGIPAYTASKGGIIALTRELVPELAPYGITVNVLSPGPTLTGMTSVAPGWPEAMASVVPLDRVAMPEEQASIVAFLASEEAAFITGHVLVADGGMTAVMGATADIL